MKRAGTFLKYTGIFACFWVWKSGQRCAIFARFSALYEALSAVYFRKYSPGEISATGGRGKLRPAP